MTAERPVDSWFNPAPESDWWDTRADLDFMHVPYSTFVNLLPDGPAVILLLDRRAALGLGWRKRVFDRGTGGLIEAIR